MQNICIYCGSNKGENPNFQIAATAFASALARNGLRLVYGGGNVGLMGVIAETALAEGGEVIGVIPKFLVDMEVAHNGLTELRVVESMHERKQMMADLADAFVVLPGGIGTLEELFEVFTWRQLKLHQKPIFILNIAGYYDFLIHFLDNAVAEQFLHAETCALILIETESEVLIDKIKHFKQERGFDRDKI
jgi:hypothetical protein